ncbi:MAG: threonylcarbamoyl-AMP synthase [Deltaproteobacteria bacterium HGW-Deltaproteobacteria-19]|nr:MAG: threonylcarbamoyl-AMP synthase [Deltaproteobacteria bacterium HGW-Deltaproteobacteria-19]
MADRIEIHPEQPDQRTVERIAGLLRDGHLVAYPTETFYGLGADATNPVAVDRIFAAKGRDFKSPVSLIIGRIEDLDPLVEEIPAAGHRLIDAFWPGALTLVFRASGMILPVLTASTGKIGIRLSGLPAARAIAAALGKPVTATSANRSGAKECNTASEVLAQIGDAIDAVADGGATAGGLGSTFVDVSGGVPVILRQGAIAGEDIWRILGKM